MDGKQIKIDGISFGRESLIEEFLFAVVCVMEHIKANRIRPPVGGEFFRVNQKLKMNFDIYCIVEKLSISRMCNNIFDMRKFFYWKWTKVRLEWARNIFFVCSVCFDGDVAKSKRWFEMRYFFLRFLPLLSCGAFDFFFFAHRVT